MLVGSVIRPRTAKGEVPSVVTLIRKSSGTLDGDGLQSALKATRDGVADWLGVDDGDKRLTWRYQQERGAPKTYQVRIEVQG